MSTPLPGASSSQTQPTQEELISEIKEFLVNNPPKKRLSSVQIDELLLANAEIYLEIKRERKTRKNKNFVHSNLINLVSKFEKNIIKLSRSIPVSQSFDPETFDASKSYYLGLYKRKSQMPQAQQPTRSQVNQTAQIKTGYTKTLTPGNFEHHYTSNPNLMIRNDLRYSDFQNSQGKFLPNQAFHQNTTPIIKQQYIAFNNNSQEFQGSNMGNMAMGSIGGLSQMNNMSMNSISSMNSININSLNLPNSGGNMGGLVNNMSNIPMNTPSNMNNLQTLNPMGHLSLNSYQNSGNQIQNTGFNANIPSMQMQGFGGYEPYQSMGMGEQIPKEDLMRKEDNY